MTAITLTWAQTAALNRGERICLACGGVLNPMLTWLGSLRCHSCRASHTPLDFGLAIPIAQEDA